MNMDKAGLKMKLARQVQTLKNYMVKLRTKKFGAMPPLNFILENLENIIKRR